ncbi:hypothetical protein [Sphingomonas sp.]|uniref:hypothetical protein n=1 Tax=Sphingomonas sp. TaxID=28214 RepID=UPI0025DA1240|nr:hypothetical protein [Sphingomonas sp.]
MVIAAPALTLALPGGLVSPPPISTETVDFATVFDAETLVATTAAEIGDPSPVPTPNHPAPAIAVKFDVAVADTVGASFPVAKPGQGQTLLLDTENRDEPLVTDEPVDLPILPFQTPPALQVTQPAPLELMPVNPQPSPLPPASFAKAKLGEAVPTMRDTSPPLKPGDTTTVALAPSEALVEVVPVRPPEIPVALAAALSAPLVQPARTHPAEQIFAVLARQDPAETRWLDTVIRDVSALAAKSGDVRFRVEPEGYGRITIERTADRLEIGVSETRALAAVDAARPLVLAGAAALGAPISAAMVLLDPSGSRGRDEARPRLQIEIGQVNDSEDDAAADAGRYA